MVLRTRRNRVLEHFVLSVGWFARAWLLPARLARSGSAWAVAGLGASTSIVLNNLPAAALLSAARSPRATALLVGLNVGPNLAVTGSLSAVLWSRAARSVGVEASPRRYSELGLVIVPLAGAAAVAGLLFFPRGVF